MKAIQGQDWEDKETLHLMYQCLIKPVFNFGVILWYPSVERDATIIKRFQRQQNSAMRVMTGAHINALQDHLLAETSLLLFADHFDLLCAQNFSSASRAEHFSNAVINLPTSNRKGRKKKIHTLQSRFGDVVNLFLRDDGTLAAVSFKRTMNALHTLAVAKHKVTITNKLLGCAPPEINPIEETLPRRSKCVLSQLRSDYCSSLMSYQALIGNSPNDVCPLCHGAPHTT
jgi:hypothetical protein